jgi:hypothetical protein
LRGDEKRKKEYSQILHLICWVLAGSEEDELEGTNLSCNDVSERNNRGEEEKHTQKAKLERY